MFNSSLFDPRLEFSFDDRLDINDLVDEAFCSSASGRAGLRKTHAMFVLHFRNQSTRQESLGPPEATA
jgi:hypothetical protein